MTRNELRAAVRSWRRPNVLAGQRSRIASAYELGRRAAVAAVPLGDLYPLRWVAAYRRAYQDGWYDADREMVLCAPATWAAPV